MKKFLPFFITVILLFNSSGFAYTLNEKEDQAVIKVTEKVEDLINKYGENTRRTYIKKFENLQKKYKDNDRIYTILETIINNLNSGDKDQTLSLSNDKYNTGSIQYSNNENQYYQTKNEDITQPLSPDNINTIEDLEKYYNIKIYGIDEKFTPSEYAGYYADFKYVTENDKENYDRFIKIFVDEFKKYTPCWIKATKLKSIMIVKDLKINHVSEASSKRAAMPDSLGSAVYYDINYTDDEDYIREVIHHEFYHVIEYNTYGNFYYKDKVWNNFNKKEFKYGKGGEYAYGDKEYDPNRDHNDFVSDYSTYGLEEDKAETYSYILLNDTTLSSKINKSNVLKNKIEYMKKFITNQCQDMKNVIN